MIPPNSLVPIIHPSYDRGVSTTHTRQIAELDSSQLVGGRPAPFTPTAVLPGIESLSVLIAHSGLWHAGLLWIDPDDLTIATTKGESPEGLRITQSDIWWLRISPAYDAIRWHFENIAHR